MVVDLGRGPVRNLRPDGAGRSGSGRACVDLGHRRVLNRVRRHARRAIIAAAETSAPVARCRSHGSSLRQLRRKRAAGLGTQPWGIEPYAATDLGYVLSCRRSALVLASAQLASAADKELQGTWAATKAPGSSDTDAIRDCLMRRCTSGLRGRATGGGSRAG